MKIIKRGRRNGKTTELIRMCAENGGYIVCRSKEIAKIIQIQAKEMGLSIPLPLSYAEFIKGSYFGRRIEKIYIDDADELLKRLAHGVVLEAITISDPEESEKKEESNHYEGI